MSQCIYVYCHQISPNIKSTNDENKHNSDKSVMVVDLPQLDFEVLAVQIQDHLDDVGTPHSACLGKGDCGADGVLDSCLGFCHLAMRTVD